MNKQLPFMAVVTLAVTSTKQQYVDGTSAVPPAPVAPFPGVQPTIGASEPVTQVGVRAIPKPFQEIVFQADNANTADVQIGVVISGVVVYGVKLPKGTSRGWDGSSLRNIPLDLNDFYFLGTAGDKILISGLPNRQ